MMRIRIGMAISVLIGAMYAFCGLLTSLNEFGIGMAVAGLGAIGYGLCDHIESDQMEAVARGREAVWARRDAE